MRTVIAIQALRAVAALSVAAVHFNQIALWLQGDHDTAPALYSLSAGVDLFFAISGFVMVYSSEGLYGRPDAPRIFLARRLARIAPPYWLATLAAIPLMNLSFTWSELARSLLFIPYAIANDQIVPLLGVGWTLNFEMFFYVLFALALFAPRRLVVVIVCAALVAIVALRAAGLPGPAWWRFLSDPIVLEFASGMILAVSYRRCIHLPLWLRLGLIAGGSCAIWLYAGHMPPSGWRFALWGLPTAAVLAGAVLGPSPSSGLFTRLASTLGDASYALYLVHGLCSAILLQQWPSLSQSGVNLPTAIITAYLATVALSVVIHKLFEKPVTSGLARLVSNVAP